MPLEASASFDVPGPATLSGTQILEETARSMGLARPRMIGVPLLSPHLSSLWVRLVTRADWSVAREVVVGLTEDLLARTTGSGVSSTIPTGWVRGSGPPRPRRRAPPQPVPGAWGAIERARGLAPEHAQVATPLAERRTEVVGARYGPREREDPIADAVVAARHPPQLPLEAVERLAKGDEVEAVLADAAVGHGPAEDVGGGMEASCAVRLTCAEAGASASSTSVS